LDNTDISTSDKGKTPASTNGIETYNKKIFGDKIRKLTQTNTQLTQNKQNSDATKITIKADKNQLVSEKNTLVAKHKKLQREIATL